MEVAGLQAAHWVLGKALGSVSSEVLEAWAASTELGRNIEALKMELLYAQGMLNTARSRGRDQEIQNPALTELLQKLRDLGYRADDVLDEVDYFRIQDELDGSYHAADEHQGGCLRNCALNAHHTATSITEKLIGFSKCSRSDGHSEPAGGNGVSCGAWPCLGLTRKAPLDEEQDEEDASRGVTCGGGLWPCRRASSLPPPNSQQVDQEVDHGCMGRLASCSQNIIHAAGKHLPCHSTSRVQSHKNSNIASSEGEGRARRFLYCAWPSKAPQREHVVLTPKLKFNRVQISQTMKEIVEQLKPVCAKVSTILNLELLDSNRNIHKNATSRPIITSEYIKTEFYGREDKTTEIICNITKGEYCRKSLTVLPIVGPGGIGKTTLTQYIYNNAGVQKHFEIKLWVCVSVNFNMYRLTQDIAEKLSNGKKDSPDKIIEEGLKSKRFLLVLDDMWNCGNKDEWKRFLVHFNKEQTKGSVILVTTRFPAVAQMVKTVGQHIDLEGLSHKAFKQLFLACVFGNEKTQNEHKGLLETGDRILEKLKGSPLAAKTVGRLLRNYLDLDHWTRVLESREWESQYGDHDIMPALKLSFDYLPFHLQQCFTYCALFPEDYKFGEEELIHFWIGVDALHSHSENISIEDIGKLHLDELVNHGIFKKENNEEGGISYVIHDLLHELALKVSSHECLSIYSSSVNSIQIFPSIRHLSINIDYSSFKDRMTFHDCKEDFIALDKRLMVENLYSLLLFGKHQDSFVKNFSALFSKAKALRVIFISGENYSMEDLFPNYSNLIHLRYLRLSRGSVLSKNISGYYHLRVLHLRNLPYDSTRDMSNLRKLRHFLVDHGDGTEHSRISNVGKLKSLQGLKRFLVKNGRQGFDLREIGQLLELRGSLSIQNLEKVESQAEAEEARLMYKKHLHKVILEWDIDESKKDPACEEQVLEGLKPNSNLLELCIINHPGVQCPSWLSVNLLVKNLKFLRLNNVAWKTFPPIGKLWQVNDELLRDVPNQNFNNLTRIELVKLDRVKRWIVDSTCELYSSLKTLIIKDCNELMELSFSKFTCGQQEQNTWFPELQNLLIMDCKKFSSLPHVPWTPNLCSVQITRVCFGLEDLQYEKYDNTLLYLGGQDTGANYDTVEFWKILNFGKLTEVKELRMRDGCPPLPLDGFKKLSSLRNLDISKNDFWLVEEGRRVQFELPIENVTLNAVGVSGKELTQFLSMLPQLSDLSISRCEKITMLGVAEQEQKDLRRVWWAAHLAVARHTFEMVSVAAKSAAAVVAWCGGFGATPNTPLREEEETVEDGLLLLPPQLQELKIYNSRELSFCPDSVGLQGLSSLRSLRIGNCPKFLSPYLGATSSSSCSPFPASLQSLYLWSLSLTAEPADCSIEEGKKMVSLSNLVSLTELTIIACGDLRSFWCSTLPRSCPLTQLWVYNTPNFFSFDPADHDGPSFPFSNLQFLETDDAPGVLVAPICSLLTSSLAKLVLAGWEIDQCFTEEQEDALRLLTSLQDLRLYFFKKLQCLPTGLRGLPNLKSLTIWSCDAIRSLPKDGLPNSLQVLKIYSCPAIRTLTLPSSLRELTISECPSIRTLPKAGLPSSLRLLDVASCESEELKRHCRKLIGTIPIVSL